MQENLKQILLSLKASYGSARIFAQMQSLENSELLEKTYTVIDDTFKYAPVGIAHVAPDGTWLKVNDKLSSVLGYTKEELLGLTFQDITHPDDLEKDLSYVEQMLHDEIDSYSMEKRYIRQDKSIVWIRLTVSLVKDEQSLPSHFIWIIEDIDYLKSLENEYETIFSISKDAIAILDMQSNFLKVNKAYSDISGFSEEELLQKSCIGMSIAEDVPRATKALEEVLEKGFIENIEKSCYAKDGSIFTVNMSIAMMPDKERLLITTKDVTNERAERLGMEENILKLHLATKSANQGIWSWNLQKNTLTWDESMYNIYGLQAHNDDKPYSLWSNAVLEEDLEEAQEKVQKAIEDGGVFDDIFRIKRPNGEIRHIKASGLCQFDDNGNKITMVGSNIDITELKQFEEKLIAHQKEQSRLLALFDKGEANLFKWNNDATWSIEHVSKNVDLLMGYTYDELLSNEVAYADCIHPEDIEDVSQEVQKAIKGNTDFFKHKPYRIITKQGDIKWVLDYTVTQKNEENEITHFIGYITDITYIKEQEKELEDSEFRWKFAIEGSGDGLWDWNLENNSVYFSPQWKKMLGYKEDEIEASLEEWSRRVHPKHLENVFGDVNAHLEEKTDVYRNEHQVLCKDGSYKWILDRGIVVKRDNNNKPLRMIGTHTDIDAQKNLESELLKAKELAEQASQSKSSFLANMSHEIRTPMTGLLGFVDRLQKAEENPEKIKQFQTIRKSGETLMNIINDILDFSKIESGKMEIEYSPVFLQKFFEEAPQIFQQIASTKNINILNAMNENIPECILGDKTRLKQIVFNLMSNAIKFTHDGGNVTLQAYYKDKEKLLHVAVIDTGIGIAKEQQKKIFEAFSQEDVSTTRKFGGTGLGLSISLHLINLMGGALKLESEVGKGSTFYFDIPVDVCSTKVQESTTTEEYGDIQIQGHVLVVEDNKTNQMLLGMILDDNGLSYDIADNGAEGILKYKHNKYDVILMDENMPIMNGIEATKILREEHKSKIPIIAVTANALIQDRERFLEAGMDDYISKPYTEGDILKVLQKYLG